MTPILGEGNEGFESYRGPKVEKRWGGSHRKSFLDVFTLGVATMIRLNYIELVCISLECVGLG